MQILQFEKSTGKIVAIIVDANFDASIQNNDDCFGYIINKEKNIDPECFIVANGDLRYIGKCPSINHELINGIWTLNKEKYLKQEEFSAKRKRNLLLNESDWTELIGAENRLGVQMYTKWQAYRQKLRDISQQSGFPLDIIWPEKPV